jgi:hypothetical protein
MEEARKYLWKREAMIAVGVCELLKYFQIKAESPDLVNKPQK